MNKGNKGECIAVEATWIPPSLKLPPVSVPVLIVRVCDYGAPVRVEPAVLRPDGNWKAIGHKIKMSSVRYWMLMPDPPKEGDL